MEIRTYGATAAPVPSVISPPIAPPSANPPRPTDPNVPTASFEFFASDLKVTVDASMSVATPAHPIVQYTVDWGNGASTISAVPNITPYTYPLANNYPVTLTVTNDIGQSDHITLNVPVYAAVAGNLAPAAGFTLTNFGLQATATPTATDTDGVVNQYDYLWGDGSTSHVATASPQSYTYAVGGTYRVYQTVTDEDGSKSTQMRVIRIDPQNVGVRRPSTTTPVSSVAFKPGNNNNMQCQAYDPVNNQWFISQNVAGSNGGTTPYESTNLVRLSSTGVALDSMTCLDAGHGTSFVVEMVNNKPYIWLTYNIPATGSMHKYDIVRFPYTKGKFTRDKIPGLTVLPSFSPTSKSYVADWQAGWLCERENFKFRRRKISDYLAGIDQVYNTPSVINFAALVPSTILQGYATMNDTLFVYCGSQNGESLPTPDPARLYMIDWNSGQILDTMNLNGYGADSNGNYPGGVHEPEGLTITRDPKTQQASLLFGVVTNMPPNRQYPTWTFKNIGTAPTV